MSRHLFVYGAGSLGSVLGALLSRGAPTTLIGRPSHIEAIQVQGGLQIVNERAGEYPLSVATEILNLPDHTTVLITVKAFDLERALLDLAPRVNSSHLIVVLQNGLGILQLAQEVLQQPVVRGVTFIAAALEAPGRVALNAIGKTYFPPEPRLQELWAKADLPAIEVENIEMYVWRKLAINAVINPLSALLDVQNGELVQLKALARQLVHELVLVARHEGQPLEEGETLEKVIASMKQTARNISSMLQDVRAERPTEIDWINGVIVQLAGKHGIQVPGHQQLVELIRFISQKSAPRPAAVAPMPSVSQPSEPGCPPTR